MLARLGHVLYWGFCGGAGLAIAVGVAAGLVVDGVDRAILPALGVLAGGLIWLVGRACRYVLANA